MVRLAAFVLALLPAMSVACEIDRPFDALFIRLSTLPLQPGPVQPAVAAQIGQRVDAVEALNTPSAETLFRAEETAGSVRSMLQTGREIARTQRNDAPHTLQATLQDFRRGTDLLCDTGTDRAEAELGSPGARNLQAVPAAIGFAAQVPADVQVRRMGVLVTLLAVVSASLFLLQRALERLSILVFDRRSCLIGAHVEIGDLPIAGQITVIGRTMCHFRPANDVAMQMLKHFAGSDHARLVIDDIAVPMNIRWINEGAVGCPFEMPLPGVFFREILNKSALTPYPIEDRWHAANVRRKFSTKSTLAYRLKPELLPRNEAEA